MSRMQVILVSLALGIGALFALRDAAPALALVGTCAAAYLLPSFVAAGRDHHQKAPIILTNLFLGWTVIGWIVALIWASSAVRQETA